MTTDSSKDESRCHGSRVEPRRAPRLLAGVVRHRVRGGRKLLPAAVKLARDSPRRESWHTRDEIGHTPGVAGRRDGEFERPSLHMLMRRSWERSNERDWADVLAPLPLFSKMGKRQVRRVAKLASIRDYEPGASIVHVGETGNSFYVLLEGHARVAGRTRALRPRRLLRRDGAPRWWSALGDHHRRDDCSCDQTAAPGFLESRRRRSANGPRDHGRAFRACQARQADGLVVIHAQRADTTGCRRR
jgi:hypothetical protein